MATQVVNVSRRGGRMMASSRSPRAAAGKRQSPVVLCRVVFPTELGWCALVGSEAGLRQLTFNHRSPAAAVAALDSRLADAAVERPWNPRLVARLQAFAAGQPDDFRDVELDLAGMTPFQQRVIQACRRIAPGTTLSYGQLAARAGRPGAARAVGQCMAKNRFPLIVPCHRVVASNGLGGFSSRSGLAMKRRLLEMEAAAACP